MRLEHFNSGPSSELISRLMVSGKIPDPQQPTKVFSVVLKDVKKGDMLWFTSYGGTTNDLGFNVMLAWQTFLGDGTVLTRGQDYNVVPAMHHGPFRDVGSWEFLQDYDSIELYTELSAASNASYSKTDFLHVEDNYGNLNGILFRLC